MMNGQIVNRIFGSESAELLGLVQDLRAEVAALHLEVANLRSENAVLRQENAALRRENLELRQQVGYWKSRHSDAAARVVKLEAEVEQLRGENRQLQARLFGQKSEQTKSKDRSNHLPGETDQNPSLKRRRGQQAENPGPKRRNYDHLPVVEESVELPVNQRVCSCCGLPLTPSDAEESEQIEVEVRAYRRRIRRRRYQRTCDCPGPRTTVAPLPPKLIPKGRLGTSVWVEILLGKFFSHQPVERQLAGWRLQGMDLAPGTVNRGMQRLSPLFRPVYEQLLAHSAKSGFAQADETRWMVFVDQDGKTGHLWWLWAFLTQDSVVFRLDPSRSHAVPEGHFAADAQVVLMVDRYSAYKAMAQVKLGNVILAFCWAHVRRDFVEVGKGWEELKFWALAWLQRIRELYQHQRRRLAHEPCHAEHRAADADLRRTIAEMQTQAALELADPKLRVPCRKALSSLQEHWSGLTRFVDDLRIPMDNNASERQQRGPAVGRKNYYGSGALWSGELAAMLFSIFATLTRNDLNPLLWLKWYLETCATNGGRVPPDVTQFLPWNLTPQRRQFLELDGKNTS